jgi:uncharacterized protein (TIGR02145 family)
MKIKITIIFIFIGVFAKAQIEIEELAFKVQNNKILVSYDLPCEGIYYAELYFTTGDSTNWQGPLKNLTGDIYGIKAVKNKRISWDILKEYDWLVVDNIRFKIKLIPVSGTFIDLRDSLSYKWVKIGTQVWMAENMRALKYSNGIPIPIITTLEDWLYLDKDAHACWVYEKSDSIKDDYTVLYTWTAAINNHFKEKSAHPDQGVCPTGWHVPTLEEWDKLAKFIGKDKNINLNEGKDWIYVAKHLKSKQGWKEKRNGTDDYAFNATPCPFLFTSFSKLYNNFEDIFLWTATPKDHRFIWSKHLTYDSNTLISRDDHKNSGFVVRCIKN